MLKIKTRSNGGKNGILITPMPPAKGPFTENKMTMNYVNQVMKQEKSESGDKCKNCGN